MKTSKRRILVVDDDVPFTRVLKIGLEACGYEVLAENGASRALQVARGFKPDLIVLDVAMPGMDGGEVAQELGGQKDVGTIPIVFLTSLSSKNDAVRPDEQKETILAKPVSIVELTKCIEKRLEARRRTKEEPRP